MRRLSEKSDWLGNITRHFRRARKHPFKHHPKQGLHWRLPRGEQLEERTLLSIGGSVDDQALFSLGAAAERTSVLDMTRDSLTSEVRSSVTPDPFWVDVGDHYWADGRQIRLLRAVGEIAVRFEAGAIHEDVLEGLVGDDGVLSGYEFSRGLADEGAILKASGDLLAHGIEGTAADMARASTAAGVAWTAPVFVNSESGLRQIAGDQIVIALEDGVQMKDLPRDGVLEYQPYTPDQYIADISWVGKAALEATAAYATLPGVLRAEPNFYAEFQTNYTPDDTLYPNQWHLDHNVPPHAGRDDADVDAPEAWDTTTGSGDIVIAVVDSGVQTDHPDLNMWSNPGEIPANSIDDDANGFVDDVYGWDFYQGENDPKPAGLHINDNHGTAVTGVAAATGDNNLGVAGAAYDSKIMALKISHGSSLWTSTMLANAIYYAAGRVYDSGGGVWTNDTWGGADVLNASLT